MAPQANLIPDMAKNSDGLFFWGCDPEVTPLGFGMKMPTLLCYWFTELGIKSIYVCPDLNYGAAIHADKWIPVLPGTDAALQLAIAYQWLTTDTYDKEYIEKHTYGFDKFKEYVLGTEDGIPKTPKWASEKCGVPVWTIKALADYWAENSLLLSWKWRRLHPLAICDRTGAAGGHAAWHAGTGETGRSPVQVDRMEYVGKELPVALYTGICTGCSAYL